MSGRKSSYHHLWLSCSLCYPFICSLSLNQWWGRASTLQTSCKVYSCFRCSHTKTTWSVVFSILYSFFVYLGHGTDTSVDPLDGSDASTSAVIYWIHVLEAFDVISFFCCKRAIAFYWNTTNSMHDIENSNTCSNHANAWKRMCNHYPYLRYPLNTTANSNRGTVPGLLRQIQL